MNNIENIGLTEETPLNKLEENTEEQQPINIREAAESVPLDSKIEDYLNFLSKPVESKVESDETYVINSDLLKPGNEEALWQRTGEISEALSAERKQKEGVEDSESMRELGIENREFLFGHIDANEIINEEKVAVSDAVLNSIEAGKIPGVQKEDLSKPGFMEGFLQTSIGKKIMNSFKALVLATAMIAPIKTANAGISEIFSQGATQGAQVEASAASQRAQLEARLKYQAADMEARLKSQEAEMENRIRQEAIRENNNDRNEIAKFDAEVRAEVASWNRDPNMTKSEKDNRIAQRYSDRENIVMKQKSNYEIRVSQANAEREQFKISRDAQREQFAASVEAQRNQQEVDKKAREVQTGVDVGARVLQEGIGKIFK